MKMHASITCPRSPVKCLKEDGMVHVVCGTNIFMKIEDWSCRRHSLN